MNIGHGLCSRRHMLQASSFGLGSVAAAWLLKQDGLLADDSVKSADPFKPDFEKKSFDLLPKEPHHPPKARAMISMYMLGGPSQIDLFDPKPELVKRSGQEFPGKLKFDNSAQASHEMLGPLWDFKRYGKCGMELSEILPHLGSVADDITLIRSMHSGVNNHGQANRALYSGGIEQSRARLGNWLVNALGSASQELPAYVALTHPKGPPILASENWTNGALPSIYQGTVVRPTEPRIFNLDPPGHLRGTPQRAQLALLDQINREHLEDRPGENDLDARIASYGLAARMQVAAREAFDISGESKSTRELYGVDNDVTRDYGTRCLIARRLVERGVRFVQLFCEGQHWDHHGSIARLLPERVAEVDRPMAALITDLKERGMLDTTLVQWGGEMGRLPVIQFREGFSKRDKIGRDHNTYGFSMWVAGGGLKGGYVHGKTDEFSHYAIEDIVHHYDWLATVLHLFGLDHHREKFRIGPREVKLVKESDAQVVHKLLA